MDNLDNQTQAETAPETHSRSMAESLKRTLAMENGEVPPEEAIQAEEPPAEEAQTDATAEEAPEEGTEQEADAKAQSTTAEVEIDGKTYVVPAELKDGYLRRADYSKKTAEVAEERRAVEGMKQSVQQAFTIAQNLGPVLADYSQAQRMADYYNKVDFNALYDTDPLLANRTKIEQQENYQKLNQLGQFLQSAPQALQQVEAQSFQAEVSRNAPRALELVPDLPKRAKDMAEVGREYGFSDDELQSVSDPRHVKILRDLLELKELTKNRDQIRQKVQGAPPVAKPGGKGAAPQASQKEYQAAMRNVRNDGSTESVMEALRLQRKLQGR